MKFMMIFKTTFHGRPIVVLEQQMQQNLRSMVEVLEQQMQQKLPSAVAVLDESNRFALSTHRPTC
jgi:hypothetical protein